MASDTVTSPEQAAKHGCCGGEPKERLAAPAALKVTTKPSEVEKVPASPKTSGSCCGGNGHS